MKKKIIAVFLSLITASAFLAGCGVMHADAIEPMNSKSSLGSSKEVLEADSLDTAYTDGLNEFAFRLFGELKKEERIFLSPYSISMALSMLYNGADGNTREEMAKLLGYQSLPGYTEEYGEESNEYMNANCKFLLESLRDADPKVKIEIANSIWMSKDGVFKDTIDGALLSPVRNYYNGDIFQVDFTLEKTLNEVNQWVSDKTDGMIDPLLTGFHDPDSIRLFLANAIYFNGEWTVPFSPDATAAELFHGLKADAEAEMMHLSEKKFRYYSGKGISGAEIPYGNESLVMDVLIPSDKENTTIGEVYGRLDSTQLGEFLKRLDAANKVKLDELAFPKFTMEYGIAELKDTLEALGMKDAFDDGAADFTLINDNLVVSSVVHKAKIEVEEWGTKASGATGIIVGTTSAEAGDPLVFIVDVPFIFFIRDKNTDTILFMGQMNQM